MKCGCLAQPVVDQGRSLMSRQDLSPRAMLAVEQVVLTTVPVLLVVLLLPLVLMAQLQVAYLRATKHFQHYLDGSLQAICSGKCFSQVLSQMTGISSPLSWQAV